MFTELKEELLELRVTEKGYRHALYAADAPGTGSSSCGSSSSLTCCKICW